jgi:dUTP pyrophosphatase
MGIIEASGVGRPVPNMRRRDVTLFKKLVPDAVIPTRAHATDAGFDLYCTEAVFLACGDRALISTGVSVAIPTGAVGLVCPRSGLAIKDGVTVANAPGIVDSGYRGELKVILHNTDTTNAFSCHKHSRIAQLVVVPFLGLSTEVDELPEADRGDGGFGSTGV